MGAPEVFTSVWLRIPFFWDTTLILYSTPDWMKALLSVENSGTDHPVTQRHPRKTESSDLYGFSYSLYLRGVSVRHVNTNSGIHFPRVSGDKTAGALRLSLTYIYG
jgi:hypothetical protein